MVMLGGAVVVGFLGGRLLGRAQRWRERRQPRRDEHLFPRPGTTEAEHFKHPLSVVGTNDIAMLTRKLGGWTFHELNVPLADLKKFTESGPDLSYDFTTRAQVFHALLTGDAGPLRLSFRWMLEAGVQPVAFVHDLQNHDEITFQLTEPEGRKAETFEVGGRKQERPETQWSH